MKATDLTKENFIEILLDVKQMRALIAAMLEERGTDMPLHERCYELARNCEANSEQLAHLARRLRKRQDRVGGYNELLNHVVNHPKMPIDVLMDLARRGRCLTELSQFDGPQELLEYIATHYRNGYFKAPVTLARNYYSSDYYDTAQFAAFLRRNRNHSFLRLVMKNHDELSEAKQEAVREIFGEKLDFSDGKHNDYYWFEISEGASLVMLLEEIAPTFVGKYLAITSMDSGPYHVTKEEIEDGWQQYYPVTLDKDSASTESVALSSSIVDVTEVSVGEYDEWYCFSEPVEPQVFDESEVFVNQSIFSLIRHENDEYATAMRERFWNQVERIKAETYIADGSRLILVTKDERFYSAFFNFVWDATKEKG